jgi:hypothetical protein
MTTEDVQARLESTPVSFYGLALRLRRGASDIVSWSADRGSIRGTLSVGADPTCDWSIRGPGIAPVELWVSAPEGRLRVKSARPGSGARLDGAVLGDGWVTLEPGSRLEFGFACLALEFDAAPLSGGGEAVREMAVSFLGESLADDGGEPAPRTPVQSGTVRSSREPSRPIPLERPSREPSRPVQHDSVRPAPTARVRSQAAHVPAKKHGFRYRTRDVLNAFRGHAITSKRTWVVFYGIIGLITLCAYGAFVFLLERL